MVHLGIFLLVFAFVSFQFITKLNYFTRVAQNAQMSMNSTYMWALFWTFAFAELVFWGVYLVYQFITN